MNIEFGRNLLAGVAFSLLLSGAAAGQSLTMKVNSTSDQPDRTPGTGCARRYMARARFGRPLTKQTRRRAPVLI